MKTCVNISYPSEVRFRKKVHSQASDHVWFFLTYSQSVRAKKSGLFKYRIVAASARCIFPNVVVRFSSGAKWTLRDKWTKRKDC